MGGGGAEEERGGAEATFCDICGVLRTVDATLAGCLVGFRPVFAHGDLLALNVHTVLGLAANARALIARVVVGVGEVGLSGRHYGTSGLAPALIRP